MHNDILLVSIKDVPLTVTGKVDSRTGQFELTTAYNRPAAVEPPPVTATAATTTEEHEKTLAAESATIPAGTEEPSVGTEVLTKNAATTETSKAASVDSAKPTDEAVENPVETAAGVIGVKIDQSEPAETPSVGTTPTNNDQPTKCEDAHVHVLTTKATQLAVADSPSSETTTAQTYPEKGKLIIISLDRQIASQERAEDPSGDKESKPDSIATTVSSSSPSSTTSAASSTDSNKSATVVVPASQLSTEGFVIDNHSESAPCKVFVKVNDDKADTKTDDKHAEEPITGTTQLPATTQDSGSIVVTPSAASSTDADTKTTPETPTSDTPTPIVESIAATLAELYGPGSEPV